MRGICRSLFCGLLKGPLGNLGRHEKAEGDRVRRVLVLRHDTARHMVASLPSLRLVKRLAPHCSLDVLASKANLDIARACPEVDSAIEFPGDWFGRLGMIPSLRRRNYDLILNLMFNHVSENGAIANLIGGRRAIKVAHYPRIEHSVFYNVQALAANRGVSIWEKLPMLVADAFRDYADLSVLEGGMGLEPQHEAAALRSLHGLGMEPGRFLVLHCSAREPAFRWTEGAYADLIARILVRLGLKVLLLCDGKDEAMATRLKSDIPGVEVYPIEAPFLEQAAVLARAWAMVSSDLTLPQVCYAVGTPIVNLSPWMGDAQELWHPVGETPWRQIVAPPGCGVQVIPADRVWEALSELAVRY